MMILFFIAVSCNSYQNVSSNESNKTTEPIADDYESNWVYFDLQESTELKIISHQLAGVGCGTIATASVTIGVTKKNDTIRVFELCNTKKDFPVNGNVIIEPATRPSFTVMYPKIYIQDENGSLLTHPVNKQVLKTTYGIIERKK
ncbi:hypothetical protein DVK85_05905 [Flavobacterium arcticum]|uniref:Uncharacterized protein n=2 Tax=Flavobacterium arcticum TaxID=1784713 RepID=A0A345HB34_9FLAO|nr:hypothetical protein DVK85_05905 [Flavobacterium arcticum]